MAPTKRANSQETEMALIKQQLDTILKQLATMDGDMKSKFASATDMQQLRAEFALLRNDAVTQDQYWPIKTAVYGGIGLILMGALGTILSLVFRSHS